MREPDKTRTYVGNIRGFPSWEVLIPDDCAGSCETAWHSAEGMPCELIAQTRNHLGYRVQVRFLLDDTAEPYDVQVAGVELEDNRHQEVNGERSFTGYGDPRPPSDVTKALERLRVSGLAAAMRQVFQQVTDWERAATDHQVDPEENRQAVERVFDKLALVADVYNHADRHPLKAVMQELGMPKSTAALYVRQAKERGDIPTAAATR
ncbi:hypothetical protein ACIO3S_24595 [Nocardioides sp. NPDC087217]|uniref:hypothetical protein n=1 Tax=Nocardioides sp. NPDC087217 TaxID=3364335 RepID=UPI0037F24A4F